MTPLLTRNRLISIAMGIMFLAAIGFLILGIFTPLITIEKRVGWRFITLISESNTVSLFSTTLNLFLERHFLLFGIVFIFSMLFPLAKIFLSMGVWYSSKLNQQRRNQLAHLLAITGKWSMLDVMVVGLLVVILKLGDMVSVAIHRGLLYFAVSVLLSMAISVIISRSVKLGS